MSGWVRFENTMPENLKVAPISDRAFRLWLHAICYCSRARTSGKVPAASITTLSASASKRTVQELLEIGLLEHLDERTYLVHDYLDYNPSRERIDEMRDGARERTAAWRRNKSDGDASHKHHSRVRDRTVPLTDPVLERVQRLCERLAERIRENDPKANPQSDSQRWFDDMRLLVKDRGWSLDAADEVERMIDWCQSDSFWRSNILSPGKLRKQFTQLVLKANATPNGKDNASAWIDQIDSTKEAA